MRPADFEILIVNYNTPDLLDRIVTSIRKFEHPGTPIHVIDGSDTEDFKTSAMMIGMHNEPCCVEQTGWNIHHGPGIHKGLMETSSRWVLVMDSDVTLKDNMSDKLYYDHPLEGFGYFVNRNGMNVHKQNGETILYLHPRFLLVDALWYKNHPFKFIKHGAPAINLMAKTPNELKRVMHKNLEVGLDFGGRGTVSRFGYNL
jgi:hypothetical protein